MGDFEIERLSREIYQKHSRAIDLIVKHQYRSQEETRDRIKQLCEILIDEQENFDLRYSGKNKIGFEIRYWKVADAEFLLEFWNYPKNLELKLFIGPGSKEVRQRLFQMVRNNDKTFASQQGLGGRWSVAYNLRLLEEPLYSEASDAEREAEIRRCWTEFLEDELPRIDAALKEERWIWGQPTGADNTIQ